MPRKPRVAPAGYVYHVWNRAAGRLRLFRKDADYLAFERVIVEAHERTPLPILGWCVMPNHWHFVVMPNADGQVTDFFRWLTHTHAVRVRGHQQSRGIGPLYQGRFKSLPVETGPHLRTLLRYVERNSVRAKLAKSAVDWRWGSAAVRAGGRPGQSGRLGQSVPSGPPVSDDLRALLSPWPVPMPRDWRALVDEPQTPAEQEEVRASMKRSRPFGGNQWVGRTATKLGLEWTLRPRGRPKTIAVDGAQSDNN